MTMGIAALALEARQPYTGRRVADNAFHQGFERRLQALDLKWSTSLDGLAYTVKFLLYAEVSKGAHTELGGQVGADAVLGKVGVCQFAGETGTADGALGHGSLIHSC